MTYTPEQAAADARPPSNRASDCAQRCACALGYRPLTGNAPRVLAAGRGRLAQKILEAARVAGVPIHEDAGLAQLLCRLAPLDEIPPELYQPVALLLAAVYKAAGTLAAASASWQRPP